MWWDMVRLSDVVYVLIYIMHVFLLAQNGIILCIYDRAIFLFVISCCYATSFEIIFDPIKDMKVILVV